ncbi:MAG: hypothetical protein WAW37_20245 [Syntrophobacteraceae bacterium]
MRKLTDYSRREWFRSKPLDHFLIQVCNDALQRGFLAWKPKALDRFLQNAGRLRGGNIGLVVAYEQPWALDWLLRMAARHIIDGTVLVFDNSRRAQARVEIERVCRERNAAYLPLPPNPTRHPNRSHGMAMTWIFHNVVRAIKPRAFCYIDHDLIPMETIELARTLGDQPFYGVLRTSLWGWALWAGYCMYDFETVRRLPLNFLNDFSNGLDTGGRNWSRLYRNYDRSRLQFCTDEGAGVVDPLDNTHRPIVTVDNRWIHLMGASYHSGFRDMFDFYERLAKASDEGATLEMLSVKKSREKTVEDP